MQTGRRTGHRPLVRPPPGAAGLVDDCKTGTYAGGAPNAPPVPSVGFLSASVPPCGGRGGHACPPPPPLPSTPTFLKPRLRPTPDGLVRTPKGAEIPFVAHLLGMEMAQQWATPPGLLQPPPPPAVSLSMLRAASSKPPHPPARRRPPPAAAARPRNTSRGSGMRASLQAGKAGGGQAGVGESRERDESGRGRVGGGESRGLGSVGDGTPAGGRGSDGHGKRRDGESRGMGDSWSGGASWMGESGGGEWGGPG